MTHTPPEATEEATTEVDSPRRASLAQQRSRRTRRELVRAAMTLWTERGFERGIEDTTVEEIAREAGVTKGTFYFHFAHKEDVLLEAGWGTSESMYAEVETWITAGRTGREVLDDALASLARRVDAAPKVAVFRIMTEFFRRPWDERMRRGHAFQHVFQRAIEQGRARGELAASIDADQVATILAAVTTDAVLMWASGEDLSLLEVLRFRAGLVMAGAAALANP